MTMVGTHKRPRKRRHFRGLDLAYAWRSVVDRHQRLFRARAAVFWTASWTFSNARTSIWRTRSRLMSNSVDRSSSVIGSSRRRLASKIRRSRSLSTASAPLQHRATGLELILFDQHVFLAVRIIHQPVLPLAGFAFARLDRRIQRGVAGQAAVHRDHFLFPTHSAWWRSRPPGRGRKSPSSTAWIAALDLAQVEEQPLLVGGGAHLDEAPRAQDVFLDRGP